MGNDCTSVCERVIDNLLALGYTKRELQLESPCLNCPDKQKYIAEQQKKGIKVEDIVDTFTVENCAECNEVGASHNGNPEDNDEWMDDHTGIHAALDQVTFSIKNKGWKEIETRPDGTKTFQSKDDPTVKIKYEYHQSERYPREFIDVYVINRSGEHAIGFEAKQLPEVLEVIDKIKNMPIKKLQKYFDWSKNL